MYKASEGGHLQVVDFLLSKGAKVDSGDEVSTCNNVMYCVTVIMQSVCGIVPYMIKHTRGKIFIVYQQYSLCRVNFCGCSLVPI